MVITDLILLQVVNYFCPCQSNISPKQKKIHNWQQPEFQEHAYLGLIMLILGLINEFFYYETKKYLFISFLFLLINNFINTLFKDVVTPCFSGENKKCPPYIPQH